MYKWINDDEGADLSIKSLHKSSSLLKSFNELQMTLEPVELHAEVIQTSRRLEGRKPSLMSSSIMREDENEDLDIDYASDAN